MGSFISNLLILYNLRDSGEFFSDRLTTNQGSGYPLKPGTSNTTAVNLFYDRRCELCLKTDIVIFHVLDLP